MQIYVDPFGKRQVRKEAVHILPGSVHQGDVTHLREMYSRADRRILESVRCAQLDVYILENGRGGENCEQVFERIEGGIEESVKDKVCQSRKVVCDQDPRHPKCEGETSEGQYGVLK